MHAGHVKWPDEPRYRIVWMRKRVLVSGWRENHLLSYCIVLAVKLTRPIKMERFLVLSSAESLQ